MPIGAVATYNITDAGPHKGLFDTTKSKTERRTFQLVHATATTRTFRDQKGKTIMERRLFPRDQHSPEADKDEPVHFSFDFSNLYPLSVGKKLKTSEPWHHASWLFGSTSETCEVISKTVIKLSFGHHDAYKVTCFIEGALQVTNTTYTYYVSNDIPVVLRKEVPYILMSKSREVWELVDYRQQ